MATFNYAQKSMKTARISDKGLCVIGILVVILWGMIVANHLILRSAQREATRTMRRIRSLQMQEHSNSSTRSPRPRVS
jgi:hypothetical protein